MCITSSCIDRVCVLKRSRGKDWAKTEIVDRDRRLRTSKAEKGVDVVMME